MTHSNKREIAKRTLRHYFATLARASNVHLPAECYRELDELIDAVIEAAKEEIENEAQTRTVQ